MKLSMPRFDQAPVLVVGDVMLDRYWHGGTSRISPEAPVPANEEATPSSSTMRTTCPLCSAMNSAGCVAEGDRYTARTACGLRRAACIAGMSFPPCRPPPATVEAMSNASTVRVSQTATSSAAKEQARPALRIARV
ncbi:hypothetical protein EON68_04620 [archaeon]|nr:MAG: hypothetical protein EON68_04620 [archaeon]